MDRFSFRIEACEASIEGFDGVVLAGPVLDRGLNFHGGDTVVVPTHAGSARTECLAFVFPRWGAGRENWLSITVDGVDPSLVLTGGVAYVEPD
ncbi:hypothetical protein [Cellulomonas sp. KRMCY2]|uniref:hypothetical protein n=1 Tax=Cellulomonas sp. KRMCY2 TaxID=1304865 RepID=UPI00045E6191|nr:hypothetical protein [Cellulomonas sp. KRMCY2]